MRWSWAVLIVGTSGVALAQPPGMGDKRFQEAAMTVMAFDTYADRCAGKGGLSAADSATIATWRADHGLDLIRGRIAALEAESPPDRRVGQARSAVNALAKIPLGSPCTAAMNLARNAKNQFATVAPDLIRSLQSAPPAPAASAPASPAPAAPAQAPSSPTTERSPARDELLAQIEAFGFASGMTMGVGGFLTTRIYPVVLFRNGDALKDVEGLSARGGTAQHRREQPDKWTRWRRQGNEIQLLDDGTWEKLPFNRTYPKLPDDFRLEGLFRYLSGAGTEAIGGDQSVTAFNEYEFSRDGSVRRGGGAGARSGSGTGAVATAAVAPERRGRYRVQGLEVLITWDSGDTERRILIADPNDPRTAIWLDGVGYARRDPRPR